MPIDLFPVISTVLLIAIPLITLRAGRSAFLLSSSLSVLTILFIVLAYFIPGWILSSKASRHDPSAIFELARWTETHNSKINQWILWLPQDDPLEGYELVQKAADLQYLPAIYTQGVRLKYGNHVPRPADWKGPGGNHFPQPERGQALIDKAISLGYKPSKIGEEYYYNFEYRWPLPDKR